MGQLTLSKLQYKQYKEIKDKFSASEGMIYLSDDDAVRLQEVLTLLEFKGYIREFQIDGTNAYRRMASFDSFDAWHKDQQREERKLSAREWKIGLIGALIGLIPFIVSDVIPWIAEIIKKLQ